MTINNKSDDNHLGFNTMQEERLMVVFWKSAVSTLRVTELCPFRRYSDLEEGISMIAKNMANRYDQKKHQHTHSSDCVPYPVTETSSVKQTLST